jgi:hypothetical protein
MRVSESSVLELREGELIVITRGITFPPQGGAQSGTFTQEFNLSEHLRKIIREELLRSQT